MKSDWVKGTPVSESHGRQRWQDAGISKWDWIAMKINDTATAAEDIDHWRKMLEASPTVDAILLHESITGKKLSHKWPLEL